MKRLFRPARSSTVTSYIARTLGQTIVFWTVLLWIVPAALVRLEDWASLERLELSEQRPLAVAGFAAASVLGLWSGITMAAAGRGTPLPISSPVRLVVSGPYAWVRNPMAVAGLAQGAFVGLYRGSWSTLAYVAAGFFLWNWFVRPIEEADLRERFGVEYTRYCEQVSCWIPRVTRWSAD